MLETSIPGMNKPQRNKVAQAAFRDRYKGSYKVISVNPNLILPHKDHLTTDTSLGFLTELTRITRCVWLSTNYI